MLLITKDRFLYPTMFMIKNDFGLIPYDVDDRQGFMDRPGPKLERLEQQRGGRGE
jgi:hypothetical protein